MVNLWDCVDAILGTPKELTLKDIENTLCNMYRNDPDKAARSVGNLYGQVFKKKEADYDALQAR
jgi:hypothetical protein